LGQGFVQFITSPGDFLGLAQQDFVFLPGR